MIVKFWSTKPVFGSGTVSTQLTKDFRINRSPIGQFKLRIKRQELHDMVNKLYLSGEDLDIEVIPE